MTLSEPQVTVEIAKSLGLLPEEFEKIQEILGRMPNFTELSIFSVMWSEHCSYKNSITYLKKLPRSGKRLLVEAGEENAGLVDLGDGLACCFKIESHNHPSAIEPFQGAATGVGGIHRDIFTMGARPIASLNSLRFGNLDSPHMRHLVKGHAPVTVFLTNGVKLSGTMTWSDDKCLTLARDGITQLVMLHAIATVMPQDAFSIYDLMGNEG